MLTQSRQFGLRIALFYAGLFVVSGVAVPFLPVWFKLRGLSSAEIGICMAFPLAARLIFMPIGSWVTNRAPSRRMAVQFFALAGLALLIPGTTLVGGFWPILLLVGLATTVMGLTAPASDALALSGVRRFGLDYGAMRVWGSISFIVISVICGLFVGHFGSTVLTPLLIGAYVAALITSLFLPTDLPSAVQTAKPVSRRSALTNPDLVAVIVASALVQASHAVFYTFGTIYWQHIGFSDSQIGFFWAAGVFAEVMMFAISGRVLRKMDAETLVLLGCVGAIVRWALFPYATSFVAAFGLQALHALTFAAAFAGMQIAIAREVPDEMTTSAQSIWQIASGLAMAALEMAAGPLYAHLNGAAFQVMAVLGVLAVIALRLPRKRRSNPKGGGQAG